MNIQEKILEQGKIKEIIEKNKKQGRKIGFCSGCYDIIHSGHAAFFQLCKEISDILIVSVGKDDVVRELKGFNRPINPEQSRVLMIAAMQDVDYVVLGEELKEMRPGKIDFYNIIRGIMPDFFLLNEDDSAIKEKQELCDELGIKLKLISRAKEHPSTSEIIKKINHIGK